MVTVSIQVSSLKGNVFYFRFGDESTNSNLTFQLLVFELENCKQPQVLFSLEPKTKVEPHYQK